MWCYVLLSVFLALLMSSFQEMMYDPVYSKKERRRSGVASRSNLWAGMFCKTWIKHIFRVHNGVMKHILWKSQTVMVLREPQLDNISLTDQLPQNAQLGWAFSLTREMFSVPSWQTESIVPNFILPFCQLLSLRKCHSCQNYDDIIQHNVEM